MNYSFSINPVDSNLMTRTIYDTCLTSLLYIYEPNQISLWIDICYAQTSCAYVITKININIIFL